MTTQPRSPAQHYAESERLLGATDETPANAAILAVAHAVLALAPRRARRQQPEPGRHSGDSLQERWLRGDDLGGER
jgi:hypothetical protein